MSLDTQGDSIQSWCDPCESAKCDCLGKYPFNLYRWHVIELMPIFLLKLRQIWLHIFLVSQIQDEKKVLLLHSDDFPAHQEVVHAFASFLDHCCGCSVSLELWRGMKEPTTINWFIDEIQDADCTLIITSEGAYEKHEAKRAGVSSPVCGKLHSFYYVSDSFIQSAPVKPLLKLGHRWAIASQIFFRKCYSARICICFKPNGGFEKLRIIRIHVSFIQWKANCQN